MTDMPDPTPPLAARLAEKICGFHAKAATARALAQAV